MATPQQIADLRRLINEPTQDPYTDQMLSDRIDEAGGDVYAVARSIWIEKAARYSGMIDIQEGNSRRQMSQLYKNALAMADSMGEEDPSAGLRRPTRTRQIERP